MLNSTTTKTKEKKEPKTEPKRITNKPPKKSIISRIYYAHCKVIYNTPQEERDVAILSEMGFEVINPNDPQAEDGCKSYDNPMEYFENIITFCDYLAFRALPGGAIPAGVAHEIQFALSKDMIVIELPTFSMRKVQTVSETRQYLMETGQR